MGRCFSVGPSFSPAAPDAREPAPGATGQIQILRILISFGANVSVKDNFGRTPLLEAVRANHNTTAALLFEAGAVLGLAGGRLPPTPSKNEVLVQKSVACQMGYCSTLFLNSVAERSV